MVDLIYELSFWLKIEVDIEKEQERVINIIKKHNGEIVFQQVAKKRRLAYPIEQQTLGYFCAVYFRLDSDSLETIKTELRANKQILRFVILKRRASVVLKDKKREERRVRLRAEDTSSLKEANRSDEESLKVAVEAGSVNESQ